MACGVEQEQHTLTKLSTIDLILLFFPRGWKEQLLGQDATDTTYSTWDQPTWPGCIRIKWYPHHMLWVLWSSIMCLLWQGGYVKLQAVSPQEGRETSRSPAQGDCGAGVRLGQGHSTIDHPPSPEEHQVPLSRLVLAWPAAGIHPATQTDVSSLSRCPFLLPGGQCHSVLLRTWS